MFAKFNRALESWTTRDAQNGIASTETKKDVGIIVLKRTETKSQIFDSETINFMQHQKVLDSSKLLEEKKRLDFQNQFEANEQIERVQRVIARKQQQNKLKDRSVSANTQTFLSLNSNF